MIRVFVIGKGSWHRVVRARRMGDLEDALADHGCPVPWSVAARVWHAGVWDSLEEHERFHGWNACEVLP